jgi:3-oxoacid CoA-transferase subunit A
MVQPAYGCRPVPLCNAERTPVASKVRDDANAALDGVLFDGMTIMAGGFGLCGIPENLIAAIRDAGTRSLTVISNNCGVDDFGLGILLAGGQIDKMISSYVGENKLFEQLYLSGKLELEFNPQGTLAERIRAGGAGIPAFFTKTGVGTLAAEGKEVREFDGELYVMERGLTADLAIVMAWKGDAEGNLTYRKTARNFNPMMATAGKVTVAEVEHLVPVGSLDKDAIHTPGIFVDRIFQGAHFEKRIEQVITRKHEAAQGAPA